jgi:serine phosphatase RsbU (regulator of sigma subunit)
MDELFKKISATNNRETRRPDVSQKEPTTENQMLKNEIEILTSLILKIHMDMDLEHFLDEIIFTLRHRIPFDGCNVSYIDKEGLMTVHRINPSSVSPKHRLTAEQLEEVFARKVDYKTSSDWASIAAREKKEIYIPEVHLNDFTPDDQAFLKDYGITGLYYLPLVMGDRVHGTMRFHNYDSPMKLTEFEKNLIRTRASVVAKALDDYFLYQDLKKKNDVITLDLDLATRLQRNLLPDKFPAFDGVEVAAAYIPMIEVGGDYYDFLYSPEKGERRFGVLITDASGHGVSAAFITSMLKLSFQNRQTYKNSWSPSYVLSYINRSIKNLIADNFVTGCYAYFDFYQMNLVMSSAGHNPVYRVNRDTGEVDTLKPHGKILGLFDYQEFQEIEIPVKSGHRFLFYTDGLTEAENREGVPFENNLVDLLAGSGNLTADNFCRRVEDHLRVHGLYGSKTTFDDDIAMVIIDIQ